MLHAIDRRRDAPASEAPFVPADGASPSEATRFECGLCGAAFTHGGLVCGACPMNAGCDLVRCPNCGYQFPRTSRTAEWGRRIWRRLFRGSNR